MAIPDNYIDKITKDGDSRMISPAADKVRVNNENYQGSDLDEVLNELQSAINSLQSALNTLIGSGNVQGAIDTFNEVKAFLNGIDTSDPTLANQLLTLNNAISAVQTSLAAKANSADVYTKSEVDTKVANAGKVKSVTINGTNHLPDESTGIVDLGTFVGQKGDKGDKGDTGETGATGPQGPQGNSGVASADAIESVNNLNGGTTDTASKVYVLGANMGKALNDKIRPFEPFIGHSSEEVTYELSYGYKSYGVGTGSQYTEPTQNNNNYVRTKLPVSVGDTITVYGKTDVWCSLYLLTDSSGVVLAKGGESANVAEADAITVNIQSDGYAYLSALKTADYGCAHGVTSVKRATASQDGIMTKEQAAALAAAGGPDVDTIMSYLVNRTDTSTGEFTIGSLKNYNIVVGNTYNGGIDGDSQDFVYCVLDVLAGDTVTLWATTNAWNHGYIICDSDNKVVAVSGNWFSATQASPTVLNIAQDGKVWIASNKANDYGASLSRTYRAFRNATAEQDGLMPKEIAALFGGDVSGDDAASLKLKTFAFIGDSFSAPGSWQSTMCSILGAMLKKNKAVSGGAWCGTDSVSAYAQAQALVTDAANPDYILCLLGTNDIANRVTLGDIADSETIGTATGNVNPSGSITGGIQATLITLKRAYPNAIIKIGYTPAGYIHDAFNSIANVEALCNRMKELAHIYGVGYIETRDCGICPWMEADLHAYTGSTSGGEWRGTGHPSGAGQTRIGQYMARIMLSNL